MRKLQELLFVEPPNMSCMEWWDSWTFNQTFTGVKYGFAFPFSGTPV